LKLSANQYFITNLRPIYKTFYGRNQFRLVVR
jgi:hypothetical protein